MRGIGKHTPPADTQPAPADNTSERVMYQVRVFTNGVPDGRYGINGQPRFVRPLIHAESAREIAAWWQAPRNAFAVFASTGTITDSLADEITHEINFTAGLSGTYDPAEARSTRDENLSALRALLAYVKAAR
jgi:hypothetical protein